MISILRRHPALAALFAFALACPVAQLASAQEYTSGAPPLPAVEDGGERGADVPAFNVAKGYKVSVAIASGGEARFMQFDSYGTLYISSPNAGVVTSYKASSDGHYEKLGTVVTRRRQVHGMDFVADPAGGGWLWYTTSGGVYKGKVRADGSALDEKTAVIPENGTLPSGGGHWWRSILVDPDGFYTSIGDPGNLTDQTKTDREKVWHYSLDGKTRELFCSGIRNTEKLRHRPGTTEVWGCDHGSDNFGALVGGQDITDRIPGEEINHYEKDKFYGHPFVVDANLIRPEFSSKIDINDIKAKATPPEFMFPAHFADCGWTWLSRDFGTGDKGGKKGDMCVTSHGSWNSSLRVGYCVSLLHFDANGKPIKAERIVSCLEGSGNVLGRPVDVVEDPASGDLLFSVDAPAGRVYRLSASK